MEKELLGDYRSVIRSYRLYEKSQNMEIKKKRLETFKSLAIIFQKKWNPIMGKDYSFSEWVRYIERSKKDEQFHERISR